MLNVDGIIFENNYSFELKLFKLNVSLIHTLETTKKSVHNYIMYLIRKNRSFNEVLRSVKTNIFIVL